MRGFKKRFILLQIYEILQPYPAIRSFACSQQTIKPGPLAQQRGLGFFVSELFAPQPADHRGWKNRLRVRFYGLTVSHG